MTDARMPAPIAGLSEALAATPGRPSVRLGTVIVGADALAELSGVVSAVRGQRSGPIVVLTDAVAYPRGGDPDITHGPSPGACSTTSTPSARRPSC